MGIGTRATEKAKAAINNIQQREKQRFDDWFNMVDPRVESFSERDQPTPGASYYDEESWE